MIPRPSRLFGLLAFVCAAAFLTVAPRAMADGNPVVVELFTSQGCSSCPPADALLHELAGREDVIALALHVDYWDYIGWKDKFASPSHSDRQRAYAISFGKRSVYTPQMVVNGQDSIVGAKAMKLADAIQAHKARDTGVQVSLARKGGDVQISATNTGGHTDMIVHVLRYVPAREVKITRGENAGRTLKYSNVVQDWRVLAEWRGRGDLQLDASAKGDAPVVVLIQAADQGPILAAAQLR